MKLTATSAFEGQREREESEDVFTYMVESKRMDWNRHFGKKKKEERKNQLDLPIIRRVAIAGAEKERDGGMLDR